MAKVKKTYSLDEEVVEKVKELAGLLHLSESAFVSLMISQIGSAVTVTAQRSAEALEKREGGEECE